MASGKTLQSTIEISGVLSPTLQKVINSAVDKLEEMSAETLESADAAARLAAEMDQQENILKAMQRAYAGYAAQGEESSEAAQDLADRIRTVSGELDENRDTLKAAEKAAQGLTDTQEDVADAFTRLEKKISGQEDELSALRREYANVVLEQGKGSKEARQLANKIADLSDEVNKNKNQLTEAENVVDRWGNSLEDAGRKAEESSEGFTIMKGAISDLVADAISKGIEAFKELATEGDTALGMLEARTGATEKTMEGFEDVMYDVYNSNYGENLGDVSEKLSTVIQMTDDLDNASLSKITKNAIALEDVFGFEVSESMRAVNSLMDQFGITSDEAFNLIVQGAQNGLNQNDDLLDTINEYSVQFRTAGYGADDMFNMLNNGAATGTWSVDKLGDAVKEFNIRMSDGTANEYLEQLGVDVDAVMAQFNKGGPDAQKAIGTVMDAVLKCDDATLQYQAGVGLFGTMWEDLGADTVASLMNTQGEIDKTAAAMEQMDSAAYDTLESSLSQLGRTVKSEVVQPIADSLVPVAKQAVDFVNNNVAPAVDWILKNLPTLAVVLAGVAAAVVAFKWASIVDGIKKVGAAFKAFGALLASNPIGLIIIAVTALVAAFVYLWQNCEGFRNFWINLWDKIKSAVGVAADWIKNAWGTMTTFFSDIWEKVKNGFSTAWTSITSFLSKTWETIKNVIKVGVMFIGSILDAAFQIITLPFRFIWENCKEYVFAAWEWIKGKVSTALNAVKSVITTVWNVIKSVTSSVWNSVKSVISTVWGGIKSAVSAAINAVKSVVSSIWNSIKSVTSTVWNGIKSAISNVWNGIKSSVTNAVNSVKSKVSGVWNSIKSVTSSVWNGIKNAILTPIENARDKIKGIVDKIKGFFSNMKISLPKIKLPHFKVTGELSLNPPSVPKLSIDWYKDGGIMTRPTIFGASGNTLMAGGEAGAEAILPLSVLWDKMADILRRILNGQNDYTGGTPDDGLTATAGKLLTLDDFSLGSLADGTNVVIYYDFSGFTWSPQIQSGGTGEDKDDLMARLRAHEAEFFEWLEEFIQMREVAQYA